MRIAHLESGRHLYGGAQQVLALMAALGEQGHDGVLLGAEGTEVWQAAAERGLEATPFAVAGDHDASVLWRLGSALRGYGADVLHVHSRRGADSFGGYAARLAGVPAVLSRRVDNPLGRWQARLTFAPYRRVIAISDAIAAVVLGAGLPAERLTVIRDAVATDSLVLSPDDAWFRQEFALPDDAPVIGVVAQLIERKGHADLLDALPLVLGEHPELRVLLFGRGPLEQTLRMKAQGHGLEAVVRFCGFRNDLQRILPCLDLLVHPARREGMGVAVLEAASAALPVVACRSGGLAEIVVSGETGLLVEPGEPLALADSIRVLLDNPERARAMGVRARRRIEEHFSLKAQAAAHVSLYEALL